MNAAFLQMGDHQKWMSYHQGVGWKTPTYYHEGKYNIPSYTGFSCALYCLAAKWWVSSEILNSVCVFLSTDDWLALPLPSSLPSFLIILMHSALSGSIRKSIFFFGANFKKSTIPSEPVIQLNVIKLTLSPGEGRKEGKWRLWIRGDVQLAHAHFLCEKVTKVCKHPEFSVCWV